MKNKNMKKSSTLNKDVAITVIFDNYPFNRELETAWGFSCIIQGFDNTILFDTGGDGKILLKNMKELGINTKEIEVIFLSHIHGDHTGGLLEFLEENSNVSIYLPKSFPDKFKEEIKDSKANIFEIDKPIEITKNVYSTGIMGISIHEQSLVLRTEKGLIIITGCAHPGIIQIVEKARDLLGEDVLYVMGGFHLIPYSDSEIEEIVTIFRELNVKFISPSHCSGDNARAIFEKEYKQNFIEIGVGKQINLSGFTKD